MGEILEFRNPSASKLVKQTEGEVINAPMGEVIIFIANTLKGTELPNQQPDKALCAKILREAAFHIEMFGNTSMTFSEEVSSELSTRYPNIL